MGRRSEKHCENFGVQVDASQLKQDIVPEWLSLKVKYIERSLITCKGSCGCLGYWKINVCFFQRSYLIFNCAWIKPLLCSLNKLVPEVKRKNCSQVKAYLRKRRIRSMKPLPVLVSTSCSRIETGVHLKAEVLVHDCKVIMKAVQQHQMIRNALSRRCLRLEQLIPTGVESGIHTGVYTGVTILTK